MVETLIILSVSMFGSRAASLSLGLVGLGVSVVCLVNPPAGRAANLPEPYASAVTGIGLGIMLLGGMGMLLFGTMNLQKAGLL